MLDAKRHRGCRFAPKFERLGDDLRPYAAGRAHRMITADERQERQVELFSEIVVPLDGSEVAERALPVANALARLLDAPVRLVIVAVDPSHVTEAEHFLRRAALQIDRPADLDVVVGFPAARILLEYLHPDRGAVVVMSTHARTAVGDLLLGSVADEMVRRSPVPVVLVGPQVQLPSAGATYRDLVACFDGHDESERLVPVVTALHRKLSLHPWLFEVISPDASRAMSTGDVLETSSVQHLADVLQRDGVEADWDVGHGDDRGEAIVEFAASKDAPIVALATHGRDTLDRLRESSVTVTVARTASCPVLVIGPAFAEVAAAGH
jgi:nucleotide-binding universal stress UspA family protein